MRHGRRGNPELGKWDYDGAFMPEVNRCPNLRTFSVGIFQWVERKDKSAYTPIKRGPVMCRVRGLTNEPEMVYKMAERLCMELEYSPGRQGELEGIIFKAERRAK